MQNKKEKGFTIIELVIAIFILAFAVVGVYVAFSLAVVLTRESSSRFTAAYLAQEGIEIVRNIRDNNWLSEREWQTGLDNCADQGCELDFTTMGTPEFPLTAWSDPGNFLHINQADLLYSYNQTGAVPTKFRRRVIIIFKNPDIMHVSSQVFWEERPTILNPSSVNRSIEAEEDLYDWY